MSSGPSTGFTDYSKAFTDQPGTVEDIDFDKQVKKPKQIVPGEQIIEGVTHDSIAEFVDAREARRSSAEPSVGLFARLRRLVAFRR